ncbi:MAG TPA: exo-alpha-sialidase [Clostridia bacterium]
MRLDSKWNHRPYIPYHWDSGSPYIRRIAPFADRIELEWVNGECDQAYLVVQEKGKEEIKRYALNDYKASFPAVENAEYEFYIELSNGKKSKSRLARAVNFEGVAVNYLHPQDSAFEFSGRFLGSPSLIKLSNGTLLVSTDVFAGAQAQNFSMIFQSKDNGQTWEYLTDLFPCFWGTLFEHNGALYMIAASTEYGDVIIGKSDNFGADWQTPVVLMRGAGNVGQMGNHKSAVNVLEYEGRLYISVEWGCWRQKKFYNGVLSIDKNADLLKVENWSFTGFTPPEIASNHDASIAGAIEGCMVVDPEGKLWNFLRYAEGKAMMIPIEDYDKPASKAKIVDFPLGHVKFDIKQKDGIYYAMGNEAPGRNRLAIYVSKDLINWSFKDYVVAKPEADVKLVGFQYPTFIFDGDYILAAVRTADGGAENFHDSNAITFHKIKL